MLARELNEAIELYATRAEAEQALVDALTDEPSWEPILFVTPIEIARPENAARLAGGAHVTHATLSRESRTARRRHLRGIMKITLQAPAKA